MDRLQIHFGRGLQWQLDIAQRSDPGIEYLSGQRGTYLSDNVFAAASSAGMRVFSDDSVVTHDDEFTTVRRLIWVNGNIVPNTGNNRAWAVQQRCGAGRRSVAAGGEFLRLPGRQVRLVGRPGQL